jgi:hypothetical protein
MKTLFLIVSILFLCSCNSKDSNAKVSSEEIEIHTEVKQSDKPNWSEYPYAYLKYELDSLGLSYKTIRDEDFNLFDGWVDFKAVESPRFYINSNDTFEIGNLKFEIIFDEKLSYLEKLGHYGGIKEMKIFKNGKHIQTMQNIEDPTAVGIVDFAVGDYNLDGHQDLKMRLNDNYFKSLLFNPVLQKFEHIESWDYLRTGKFNLTKKQLVTTPEGTAGYGDFHLYQVSDTELKKLKTYYYHTINDSIGTFITEVTIK